MTATASTIENLTLTLTEEIRVQASLETTFEAILEQMGPANETPYGDPLPMKIEPWPGGRWYRDLGNDNGHFWGQVQAIKRPASDAKHLGGGALLEIVGPLFMSYPVVSNVQYRLKEADGGTLITFRHTALGFIADDVRENLAKGWKPLLDRIRRQAEGGK